MGVIINLSRETGNTDDPKPQTKDQTASWFFIQSFRIRGKTHGKCLRLIGFSSEYAENPGSPSQDMIFPEKCIAEFEKILKEWKAQ